MNKYVICGREKNYKSLLSFDFLVRQEKFHLVAFPQSDNNKILQRDI